MDIAKLYRSFIIPLFVARLRAHNRRIFNKNAAPIERTARDATETTIMALFLPRWGIFAHHNIITIS